ncbi:hypothetical protein FACS1894159_06940 [Bacteroidia bacterium]|nr:hypothetical protein FACS1894159_06940 [Bacteroidia bacterium]
MTEEEYVGPGPAKSFWGDAARAGGVLGLVIAAFAFAVQYMGFGERSDGVAGMFNLAAAAITIWVYGRQRAIRYADRGFSFGNSLGYTLAMMLFAGFLFGVGQWVIFTWIIPEQYALTVAQAVEKSRVLLESFPTEQTDAAIAMAKKLSTNPLYIIFTYMIYMEVNGLLVGVLAALLLRTEARKQ